MERNFNQIRYQYKQYMSTVNEHISETFTDKGFLSA